MRTVLLLALIALQPPDVPRRPDAPEDRRLPDGRSQTEAILKEEHKRSLRELDEIVTLAQEVKADLEKHDHHVVSLTALKKLDEMDKRIKRIRGRLRR